jgi:hypothetical protein
MDTKNSLTFKTVASPMRRRTGEGDNPKKFCLLPFEEWEKVAEGRMRALFTKGFKWPQPA